MKRYAWRELLIGFVLTQGCGPSLAPRHASEARSERPAGGSQEPASTDWQKPSIPEPKPEETFRQRGMATWYGGRLHGGPTASGERFNKNAMTAAHKKLPMNTWVTVINEKNGKQVRVRINDRGPYAKKRIIDLSEAAAREIGMIDDGVVPVTIFVEK